MLTQEQQDAMDALAARFGGTAIKAARVKKSVEPAPVEAEPADDNSYVARDKVISSKAEVAEVAQEIPVPQVSEVAGDRQIADTSEPLRSNRAIPEPAALSPNRNQCDVERDEQWAMSNLRYRNNEAYTDLANVLRIFVRHPEFQGRFRFDKSMGKVLDRGEVMLGWQIDELCAVVQERFLPEIAEDVVLRSLLICANRSGKA